MRRHHLKLIKSLLGGLGLLGCRPAAPSRAVLPAVLPGMPEGGLTPLTGILPGPVDPGRLMPGCLLIVETAWEGKLA